VASIGRALHVTVLVFKLEELYVVTITKNVVEMVVRKEH